jgi:hypothetical protein
MLIDISSTAKWHWKDNATYLANNFLIESENKSLNFLIIHYPDFKYTFLISSAKKSVHVYFNFTVGS